MRARYRHRSRHRTGALRPDAETLDRARPGDEFEILEVGDPGARVNALRFGMVEGSRISCVTKIPAGPVVLRSGRQEIAIGRGLASRIRVRRISAPDGVRGGLK